MVVGMDARDRFSSAADDYARYRPGYPARVFETCQSYGSLTIGDSVVDIGCGTGISSRHFSQWGYYVTGVDPNKAMLAKAREAEGGVDYVVGEASATGLADGCADMLICAQAMHWFDLDDCVDEWFRILRGSRPCCAFWNYRKTVGWQAEYEALLGEWSSEYKDVRKAQDGGQENSAWVKSSPRCVDIEEHEFPQRPAPGLGWIARPRELQQLRDSRRLGSRRVRSRRCASSSTSTCAPTARSGSGTAQYMLLWRLLAA